MEAYKGHNLYDKKYKTSRLEHCTFHSKFSHRKPKAILFIGLNASIQYNNSNNERQKTELTKQKSIEE